MKKFKALIRATSFVLAFVLFFTSSASVFAANEAHLQMSQSAEQYQIEEPVVEEPVVEEPVVEEPVVEEPIVEEPVVKEPVVEEPVVKEHYEPQGFVPALPWVGMGAAELLKWLGALAVTGMLIYEANESWASVNDMYRELTNSRNNDKPKFFVARLQNGYRAPLLLGKPLTEGEAEAYLLQSIRNDVWAATEKDAKGLAFRLGQGRISQKENHFSPNGRSDQLYYDHYHGGADSNRVTGHIFFGAYGRPGIKP